MPINFQARLLEMSLTVNSFRSNFAQSFNGSFGFMPNFNVQSSVPKVG